MFKDVIREITPLTQNDCFTIFSRKKTEFNFPLHSHEEIELNLILHASGTKRIVGDHIEEIDDMELVLLGSNLPHGWFTHRCKSRNIHEVTIQFQKELFAQTFLQKNQLIYIRKLFDGAKRGVAFSRETIETIAPRLLALDKKTGFDSILELFSIFHDLSISRNIKMLSDTTFMKEQVSYNSRRLERAFDYMHHHFSKELTLKEVAKVANMPEASFSRFVKMHTGYTFTESLTDIRLGHVSRLLIDTTHSIAEIANKCGFNNMANFNRIFKIKKGCTPKEFKKNYTGQRVFI
ncbi:AraC family transcriptional regulator [Paraflavitalea pollutisoli]|uniref:AraC family transcriptional regulator n=1 Tax=Paraflavitalea pollutisoli TaxID=3034143 RepID=UPI0023EE211D|nr:AraC family transcriptional regulator [Paraflavitalea sp. H1-2-19X]